MNLGSWLALARPRQWVKNLLLFVAFLFTVGDAWEPGDPDSWLPLLARATAGFAIFCLVSSGGYLVNDVRDAEADRLHPRKRTRPVAAGDIEGRVALIVGSIALLAGVTLAFVLGPVFAIAAFSYAVLTAFYSARLKYLPVLDVLVIGVLFAIRAIAGAIAIGVDASIFLVLCALLGAAYVAAVKRRQELTLLGEDAVQHRPSLRAEGVVDGSRLAAALGAATFALYVVYTVLASNLPDSHLMLVTVPFVGLGLWRYWTVATSRPERDAEEVVTRDPISLALIVAFAVVSVAIIASG